MMTGTQTHEWQQAYGLLNVPPSSSPEEIKKAYRRLIKRWHPDHYPSGTPAYAEATQMTALINEAYSQISSAPLRYGAANPSTLRTHANSVSYGPLDPSEEILRDLSPNIGQRIDFWTQLGFRSFFTALALFGLVFLASFTFAKHATWRFFVFLGVELACGFAIVKLTFRLQDTLRKHAIQVVVALLLTLFSLLTLCAFINLELVLIAIFLIIALGFAIASAALALRTWKSVQDYRANKRAPSFPDF